MVSSSPREEQHGEDFDLGKWDLVTGINSPLYRSHTELEDHEDWKNAVGEDV